MLPKVVVFGSRFCIFVIKTFYNSSVNNNNNNCNNNNCNRIENLYWTHNILFLLSKKIIAGKKIKKFSRENGVRFFFFKEGMHHDQGFERIEHHMDHTLDNRKRKWEREMLLSIANISHYFSSCSNRKKTILTSVPLKMISIPLTHTLTNANQMEKKKNHKKRCCERQLRIFFSLYRNRNKNRDKKTRMFLNTEYKFWKTKNSTHWQ